jgi:hypothetical protein
MFKKLTNYIFCSNCEIKYFRKHATSQYCRDIKKKQISKNSADKAETTVKYSIL